MDHSVQVLHNITEWAGNLKDHYLTYDVCSYPDRRACEPTTGWLLYEVGQDMGRRPSWEQDDVMVEIFGEVLGTAR